MIHKTDIDLAPFSTLHLAARGRELRILEKEGDLAACAELLREERAVMLGGGSNVVFAPVVERTLLKFGEAFQGLDFIPIPPDWAPGGAGLPGKSVIVRAGAAVPLARLVSEAAARNLCGLEKLAGIPGTLGGAIFMNAGANGGCISDALLRARIFDARNGTFRDMVKDELNFAYRHSLLQEDPLLAVTGAELVLYPAEGRDIAAETSAVMERRSSSKVRFPNCGSVFRNPPGDVPAGKLMEQAGLKGESRGNLRISAVHANYFENHGGATAADFYALRDLVIERVRAASGITLVSEVRYIQ